MNGTEQRRHTAVTDELRRNTESLAELVELIDARDVQSTKDLTFILEQKFTRHEEAVALVNRRLVDLQLNLDAATAGAASTDGALHTFVGRTFWQRFQWVLLGR